MMRRTEIVETLNEAPPSRRESMYGTGQLKIVMAEGTRRPGRALTFVFAAVSAAAGMFALAHFGEISDAIRSAQARQHTPTDAAADCASNAAAVASPAAAPAHTAPAAPAATPAVAAAPAAPAAAPSASAPAPATQIPVQDDEPTRLLVTRSGGLVPSARPDETAKIERTYEVSVAVGPQDDEGVSEALVQFGRATGRVTDPVAGEFEVSSSQPLPLDPAQRRIGAAITAPGDAEIGVRLDAEGRIVEISGLEVVRRQAAWRAWDATLSPVFAEALDEEAIRSILDGVLVLRRPVEASKKPAAEEKPAASKVKLVGAWPSELE